MGLRIEALSKLYGPLAGAPGTEKNTEITAEDAAGSRDCYIPSADGQDTVCSTGNYDESGQMDDDFSINIGAGEDALPQAVQYSREYTQQLMKTVGKPEESGSEMNRKE